MYNRSELWQMCPVLEVSSVWHVYLTARATAQQGLCGTPLGVLGDHHLLRRCQDPHTAHEPAAQAGHRGAGWLIREVCRSQGRLYNSMLCSQTQESFWDAKRTYSRNIVPVSLADDDIYITFTFTFSHLADAFVQSDVQGREYSSYEQ